MQEKIYKANLLKQIMVVIRKTLYILWTGSIIVNIVEKIVCEHILHLTCLDLNYYWYKYFIFFVLIILGYSILYTFKLNKIQINISNNIMFVTKNGTEEQYHLAQTIVEFDKQVTQTFMSFDIISKYVMKTLSTDGSVKEYELLAFNQKTLYKLSAHIINLKEGLNENGYIIRNKKV